MQFGRTYEEFEVGAVHRHWPGRTITESDDHLFCLPTMLDARESASKDDRGVVGVETVGYTQDGTVVCTFRRRVLMPKRSYLGARGGDQPGRPAPVR
jgi:acyl dehydratase